MLNTKNLKCIGIGSFARVYRLSSKRVIKVYHKFIPENIITKLVKDEIKTSKTKGSLPVLRTVKVIHYNRETVALVKKYLPYKISNKEFNTIKRKQWDDVPVNFRKDHKNNIYRVDTQGKYAENILWNVCCKTFEY